MAAFGHSKSRRGSPLLERVKAGLERARAARFSEGQDPIQEWKPRYASWQGKAWAREGSPTEEGQKARLAEVGGRATPSVNA
jgi:hypothetical protein